MLYKRAKPVLQALRDLGIFQGAYLNKSDVCDEAKTGLTQNLPIQLQ